MPLDAFLVASDPEMYRKDSNSFFMFLIIIFEVDNWNDFHIL